MSLIDDIKSGSNDAIKQLYQENAQDVYDFAKGITGNHDTAMQATKSTLAKLVQQIQNGNEPANIHSEALKLAYDEACKIAMPSVQNIKSPYEEEPDAPAAEPAAPVQEDIREEAPVKEKKQKKGKKEQRVPDHYDDYEEEDIAPVSRRAPARSRKEYDNRQQPPRRSRNDYYDDRYDSRYQERFDDRYDDYEEYDGYDDYDDYGDYDEKPRHGAGFYICLIFNIILVLLLIWFLIGLLMNLSIIPDSLYHTLGYEWFDTNIYKLFG